MRKTHKFCFSPEFLERKLSLSAMGYAPAPAQVQVITMAQDEPGDPPTYPPTDPTPTDPINPTPEPGTPGGPTDPSVLSV